MTSTSLKVPHALDRDSTVQLRPQFEGSNICTWIGFKHVNYLVEEAVLDHFRQASLTPRRMFEDHGLCTEIVAIDSRIIYALHMDDLVTARVSPMPAERPDELWFKVTVDVDRDLGQRVRAVSSKVRVALRRDDGDETAGADLPELAPFVVDRLSQQAGVDHRLTAVPPPPATHANGRGAAGPGTQFVWTWRVPYFYCHFNRRLQMSGYLRLMEEAVDLFLEERGISIRSLLDLRSWIPVVPHSTATILDEALMEEVVHTVFTVEEVFKDFTFTARMDWLVADGDGARHVATGRITHGYALIDGRRDWSLVNLDATVLDAISGGLADGKTSWFPS